MTFYFEVCRQKTHVFIDAKDTELVIDLKRKIECILKMPASDQKLYFKDKPLDDNALLTDCGFNNDTAGVLQPAIVGLVFKENGVFETPKIDRLSIPAPMEELLRRGQEKKQQEAAAASVSQSS